MRVMRLSLVKLVHTAVRGPGAYRSTAVRACTTVPRYLLRYRRYQYGTYGTSKYRTSRYRTGTGTSKYRERNLLERETY